MARKNGTMNTGPLNTETVGLPPIPDGYEDMAEDIVGYWDPDLHAQIHVIPKEAKVFDGSEKTDEKKPSILIFATLVDSAILKGKDENKNDIKVEGKPGDLVGIWGKAGLRKGIFNMAGVDCYICVTGEVDTGKANKMKTYRVAAKQRGKPLPLVEDRRDKSRHAETWWHAADGNLLTKEQQEAQDAAPF